MSIQGLPERASLQYLKKLAKERLLLLRATDANAKLAHAQHAVAREHGFHSWRALKAEIDRRRAPTLVAFFRACAAGDVRTLKEQLKEDPSLVRERTADGSTGLHLAVDHPDAVAVLIQHGASPNARDVGDNASPLHFAAARGCLESVRALLDAGADVHGAGDLHKGEVIGWAARRGNEAVIDLLLARGAQHHIYSAMALGRVDLVEQLVEEDPASLLRRRSRFENEQTPLHAAFAPPDGLGWLAGQPDYQMMERLIELGADLEVKDDRGRTPLAVAMLRGDREAMRLLKAAGAREPEERRSVAQPADIAAATTSVQHSAPMFSVRDLRRTVEWYESIGFTVDDTHENGSELVFAKLSFGGGGFALGPGGQPGPRDVSLWFFTDNVEELYQQFRRRQLRFMTASSAGNSTDAPEVRFEQDLHTPFYGGRQFSICDINGLELVFWQPDWLSPSPPPKRSEV